MTYDSTAALIDTIAALEGEAQDAADREDYAGESKARQRIRSLREELAASPSPAPSPAPRFVIESQDDHYVWRADGARLGPCQLPWRRWPGVYGTRREAHEAMGEARVALGAPVVGAIRPMYRVIEVAS